MSRTERSRQQEIIEADIRQKQRQKRRKQAYIARRAFVALAAVIVVVGGIALGAYAYLNSKLAKMDSVEGKANIEDYSDYELSCVDVDGFINILVLGLDARENDDPSDWRTDTVLIVSIKEETGEVYLTSIYRDTYLLIGNNNFYDKITHAYSYGGPKTTIKTINQAMDLNIKNYVTFDFNTVVDAIDALGGVRLNIERYEMDELNRCIEETWRIHGETTDSPPRIVHEGPQDVDGVVAVAYARMRYGVGDDYKRTERARIVVGKMLEQAKTLKFKQIDNILDTILPRIKTNLSTSDIMGLAFKMNTFNIKGTNGFPYTVDDGYLGAVSYVFPANLFEDVGKLHQDVFGQKNYIPSDMVQAISEVIQEAFYGTSDVPTGVPDDWEESDGFTDYIYGDTNEYIDEYFEENGVPEYYQPSEPTYEQESEPEPTYEPEPEPAYEPEPEPVYEPEPAPEPAEEYTESGGSEEGEDYEEEPSD